MADKKPEASEKPAASAARRFTGRYWVAFVLITLAASFIGQNRDHYSVHILWITVESPMWLLLTALFVAGTVVGLLLSRRRRN